LQHTTNITLRTIVKVSILWCFWCVGSYAQDPQYSQYYASPMYLNPALTGSSLKPRFTLNYRNQWPNLAANYVTTTFTADAFSVKRNIGAGVMVMSDNQFADLSTTTVAGMAAYNLEINEELSARFGVSGAFTQRGINSNWANYTFGDQLNNNGSINATTIDPIVTGATPRINFLDLATGAVVYNKNYWAGLTVKHINRPNYALVDVNNKSFKLPILVSVQAGYKFDLNNTSLNYYGFNQENKEPSFSPSLLFERRGKYNRLDIGGYFTYEPFIVGAWYRGLPIFGQDKAGAPRNVAGVLMAGYRQDNVTFGYSYDINLLNKLTNTGGAHEISISYILHKDKSKPIRRKKPVSIPCPDL
jgi:type IX secretion system PorP/SprF family membrane protein